MKLTSLKIFVLLSALVVFAPRSFAGPYDALSETEISEMMHPEGDGESQYSQATPEPEDRRDSVSDEENEVDSELGQNGAVDAYYSHSDSQWDGRPTPIPEARPEPWMKTAKPLKKKVKKYAHKKSRKHLKAKKISKLHGKKKNKKIAYKSKSKKHKTTLAKRSKKSYSIHKKKLARR